MLHETDRSHCPTVLGGSLACLLFITSWSPAPAQGPSFTEAGRAADRIVRRVMTGANMPGTAVAVAVKDRIVWSKAYGFADLETSSPVSEDTRFRIASISKLFTGTAVALLADTGRLDLDRPIGEYLEDIPEHWEPITTRQLVHHVSGIPHYASPEDALEVVHYDTTSAALKKFKDRPLVHPPGKGETYSSFAYTVIAAVIEAATGKEFLAFMREEIFEPLGMDSTLADMQSDIIVGRSGFYQLGQDGGIRNAPYIDLSGRWAGSGYLSTAEDLARFGAAHTGPGFLSRQALELLSTPMALADDGKTREGFGWGPREGWEGRTMLWGDGSTPGARGGLLVFPDQDLTIAWLCNLRGARLERGEFQSIALRFLAEIEGSQVRSPGAMNQGGYDLTIKQGGNTTPGKLQMPAADPEKKGSLEIEGWGALEVIDAFLIEQETADSGASSVLWVLTYTPSVGILPMRLTFEGDRVSGSILRAGLQVEGKRNSGR